MIFKSTEGSLRLLPDVPVNNVNFLDVSITFDLTTSFPADISPDPIFNAVADSAAIAPASWAVGKLEPEKREGKLSKSIQLAKDTTKRVLAKKSSGCRLNSNSPEADLPKTWAEYAALYSSNKIDIEDPPRPPKRAALEAAAGRPLSYPTPFEDGMWAAPVPSDEVARRAIAASLDLFSTQRPPCLSPSVELTSFAIPNPTPTPSLANHPSLKILVQKCADAVGMPVAVITFVDDAVSRHLAIHTLLNGDRGLVISDTSEDWRVRNNMCTVELAARFYAGSADEPRVAIGTLCVADFQPHNDFTDAQRGILLEIADEKRGMADATALPLAPQGLAVAAIAPIVAGTTLQIFLSGIIMSTMAGFISTGQFARESVRMRVAVCVVFFLNMVQLAISILLKTPWKRSVFALVVGMAMMVAFFGSLATTMLNFGYSTGKYIALGLLTFDTMTSVWLWSSFAVDVVISITMWSLLRSRVAGFNPQMDTVLKELGHLSIQTASYTALTSLLGGRCSESKPWVFG
ncbi:hypothetical protein RQP46_010245 [Phenoliferia psychrophenolica]